MKKHIGLACLILLASIAAFAQRSHDRRYYEPRYRYVRYESRPHVSIVASLPFGAVRVNIGGTHYHYYNGYYYRPHHNGFIIVEPPVGIIVPVLPPGYARVVIGSRPYYRYNGIYYSPMNNGYQVIDSPAEDVVTSHAETTSPATTTTEAKTTEYEKVVIDGKTYYKKDNSYYKATIDSKGEIVYEKVGS